MIRSHFLAPFLISSFITLGKREDIYHCRNGVQVDSQQLLKVTLLIAIMIHAYLREVAYIIIN